MKTIFIILSITFFLYSKSINAQAIMVKDINLGLSNSNPQSFTNIKDTLYFMAWTATYGPELWKSDGTAAGTLMVKDILPGSSTQFWPHNLFNFKDTLYFIAEDGTTGYELWKSDGTISGTSMVIDIVPGLQGALYTSSTGPVFLDFEGALYFIADNGTNGSALWKSNGTAAGTIIVKNISDYYPSSTPTSLVDVNGTIFFCADDGIHGYELWKSDGTALGTGLVKDINPGANGSQPLYQAPLTNVNSTLYFWARTISFGDELWKSDGTDTGTVMVKDINPGATDALTTSGTKNVNLNGYLYFPANDGTNGYELWKTNGTVAGTVMVKDISPGPGSSSDLNLTVFNGAVYFEADDGTNGYELWKSDGTALGTEMVKDICPGNLQAISPRTLTDVNGTLYFCGQDGVNGYELWKSDGSTAGTLMIADINPGSGSSYPAWSYININGTIYFGANDGTNGVELWKFDSTSTIINNNNVENIISVYPNPSSDIVSLNIDNTNNSEFTLNIYNDIGTLVKTEMLKQSQQQINVEDLSNGIYMIEIKSKEWSKKQKLIIQR